MTKSANLKEMLLAFLRAELDSPTEAENLRHTLATIRVEENLLRGDDANIETLLHIFDRYRGWQDVFDGLNFPAMSWSFIELDLNALISKTFTCKNHFEREYGTRQLAEIAAAWDRVNKPNGVLAKVADGQMLEPPILIGNPSLEKLVILEGHNRLLSYLRSPDKVSFPISAIVGTAENVSQWSQW